MMNVSKKIIMITGGTGFLGEALVKRLLKEDVKEVRVFSRDEFKQSEMDRHLNDNRLRFWLGDIRDLERMREASGGVDIVIHTAAFKRMDNDIRSVYEVADVNIRGTRNVVLASRGKSLIFISTDKAYSPSCVYGASKLIAENIVLHEHYGVVWRFGNFKWSRGSVWEIFKEQAEQGIPLTITDPNSTRFVMDINEVCDYVLSDVSPGLHYPKNLKAMTVGDIAKEVALNSEWNIVGLREGEKLHEAFNENYSSDRCL